MRDDFDNPEWRKKKLAAMRQTSMNFYASAVSIGIHPFIEFAGLMNEYIKLCHDAEENGETWWDASTHTGKSLPMQTFHVKYLAEKLDCIYGPSLRKDRELLKALVSP